MYRASKKVVRSSSVSARNSLRIYFAAIWKSCETEKVAGSELSESVMVFFAMMVTVQFFIPVESTVNLAEAPSKCFPSILQDTVTASRFKIFPFMLALSRLMYCRRCGSAMAVQGSSSRDFNAEYPGDDTEIEISVMDRSLPSAKDDEED